MKYSQNQQDVIPARKSAQQKFNFLQIIPIQTPNNKTSPFLHKRVTQELLSDNKVGKFESQEGMRLRNLHNKTEETGTALAYIIWLERKHSYLV